MMRKAKIKSALTVSALLATNLVLHHFNASISGLTFWIKGLGHDYINDEKYDSVFGHCYL